MAWRIHDSVQRGEIDNRQRGIVRGRIWLNGCAQPVTLDLRGNACSDLAGCLLTFENPGKTVPLRSDGRMNPLQHGTIGDLTASRKVRVFDIPFEEAIAMLKRQEKPPEHMANCLYLEWFSEANGRVVVESADYTLAISPPAWRLSAAEEEQRQKEAAAGFSGFVGKFSQALDALRHDVPADQQWTEFDFEKLMRESDARTDKYMELLDKYMDDPDRESIIAKEMGWVDDDENEGGSDEAKSAQAAKDGTDESEAFTRDDDDEQLDVDEINRICAEAVENPPQPEPATEGVDWVREEDGGVSHPLALRAFNGAVALWHKCDDIDLDKGDDNDLCALLSEYQITSAKLAGALDGLAYGRDRSEGAFIVAYLKRALNHLHAAQAALELVAPKHLLPADTLNATRTELFALREEILRLMEEFRGQK
jgi:hypothetical protein